MYPDSPANERLVGYWLLACCAILLILVTVGGATRLTGSGLSIVDWRPVTGTLPPLSEAAWQIEFDKYRASPEYLKVNRGMSMEEFRVIFWWEWGHRFLARLLGLAFALPLAWFWWTGRLPRRLRWPLLALLALGGFQGWLGWYMVQSGLTDIPRVSPYRLAAHLGLALVIFAAMFWLALGSLWPKASGAWAERLRGGRLFPTVLGLLAVTILSGAFVAGLRAGYVYNTFPLMDGQWIPTGLLHLEPVWRNVFENPAMVQFNHRVLAISTLLLVIVAWVLGMRRGLPRAGRIALHVLLTATLMQFVLGVSTLLLYVPIWLGTLHQGGAVIVLAATLAAGHFGWRRPLAAVGPREARLAAGASSATA